MQHAVTVGADHRQILNACFRAFLQIFERDVVVRFDESLPEDVVSALKVELTNLAEQPSVGISKAVLRSLDQDWISLPSVVKDGDPPTLGEGSILGEQVVQR